MEKEYKVYPLQYFIDKHSAKMISGFHNIGTERKMNRLNGVNKHKLSENLVNLSKNTAGGRIRFKTNTQRVKIKIVLEEIIHFSHFALTGSCGIDVYVGEGKNTRWIKTLTPVIGTNTVNGEIRFDNREYKNMTLYLPLYATVKEMEIGIEPEAKMELSKEYTINKPIIFYGSSITQGCSASRPGCSYPAIVARKLDADFYNLGFSGSAHAEDVIAEYIGSLPASAIVLEYDHNEDDINVFRKNYYKFVNSIAERHTEIPIILMSRFSGGISISSKEMQERENIILSTYNELIKKGANSLHYICGSKIDDISIRQDWFVDGTHPNDLGMNIIANNLLECLNK